jgi:hypothetical protein
MWELSSHGELSFFCGGITQEVGREFLKRFSNWPYPRSPVQIRDCFWSFAQLFSVSSVLSVVNLAFVCYADLGWTQEIPCAPICC